MKHLFLALAFLATLSISAASWAAAPAMADSGLEHPWHIALGPYDDNLATNDGSTIRIGSGTAFKVDYTYFRPTRHEALASVWHGRFDGGNWTGVTTEYRWRFGGHGIGHYGIGLGIVSGNDISGGTFTSVLGVDLGQFTLESRSLSIPKTSEIANMFLVGYRF